MKNRLKLTLVAALAGVLAISLFGCKNDTSSQEGNEWRDNISLVSRNKESAHTRLIGYDSVEEAVAASPEDSKYYMSLNGDWYFSLYYNADEVPGTFMNSDYSVDGWNTIPVPSNWQTQGYSVPTYTHDSYAWSTVDYDAPSIPDENEIGVYRREVEVPADWNGQEVYISFDGVESACYVYVNGTLVGYGEDSYTSKDFRVTPYLKFGQSNTIAVKVFKYVDASWLEAQDTLKMGGIYRDVYLYAAPKTEIKDIYIDTTFSKQNTSEAMLKISADVAAYGNVPSDHYMTGAIYDQDGNCVVEDTKLTNTNIVFSQEKKGGAALAEVSGRLSISNFTTWSAENPYRYTFVFVLRDGNGNAVHTVSYKYGIREVGFTTDNEGNKVFTINGQPLTLYGVVYYENSAVNGKAMTKEEMISDIKKMKELNINAVRSPGQPLSRTFIELCDEYGLYVISDMNLETEPVSLQGAQSIPGNQNIWQTALLDRMSNVYERDKNSASVIMWSFGNQSGSGSVLTNIKNWLIENESRMILYDAYLTEEEVSDTTSIVQQAEEKEIPNDNYDTVADVIAATDWDLDKLNDVVQNAEITKPIIIQDFDMGLLSSGGSMDSYVNLIQSSPKIMGGFFANWSDMAIYVPKDSENRVEIVKNTPYETNPELYELQYAASWSDYEDSSSALEVNKYSINGIVNADRSMQSDAYELKNVYSAIRITPVDVRAGRFNVSNQNNFTSFEGNYIISYEVSSGGQVVKSGTVDGLTLAAGEQKEINLDYGTVGSTDYYVTITVKYAQNPSWCSESFDGIIFEKQYDITDNSVPVKNGSTADTTGGDFTVTEFIAPTITTLNSELAKGNIVISNPMNVNFSDAFSLYYEVIETNTYWSNPQPVIYTSGTVDQTNIGPYAEGVVLTLPLNVKAVEDGVYQVNITLTTKYAIGDIPAGYSWRYVFSPSTLSVEGIPFEIDYSRTPTAIYDDDGNQMRDENGNLMWEEGDPMPAVIENLYTEPENENEVPSSFIQISNDRVKMQINPETGLIQSFTVDGVDIFASGDGVQEGPIGNLYRRPTGGDYAAGLAGTENGDSIKQLSADPSAKDLLNGVRLDRIDAGHYRVSLQYALPSSDTSISSVSANNSMYSVVYDIYADGTLNVSVAFDLAPDTGIPTELSNILTLSGNYQNVTWYGRGPGETYPDKLYNSKVGQYESTVTDLILESLVPSGGDRSDTSWVALTDDSGKGVVITSDASKFAFNISKDYPWNDVLYSRDMTENAATIVSIIGAQRGNNAGDAADQTYMSENTMIEEGSQLQFSYRIVPVSSVEEASACAKETVSNAGTASIERVNISANTSYALQSLFADEQYLSSTADGLTITEGLGNNNQIFIKNSDLASESKGFLLQSLANNLYLTGVGISNNQKDSIEIGFAPYEEGKTWQTWSQNENELVAAGSGYSLTQATSIGVPGSRVTLMASTGKGTAGWTLSADVDDSTRVKVRNNTSGLYLTVVDNFSYKSTLTQLLDLREFNNPPDTDWDVYTSKAPDLSKFIQTSGHVTLWELLPADSQMWTLESDSRGFKIKNNSTGAYLGIRDVKDSITQTYTKTLVEYNPNNADEDPASIVWSISDVGGLVSIINVDYNLALESQLVRTKMTDLEKLHANITNDEDAFKNVYVLGIGTWKGSSAQKWNLRSSADLQVNVQAGENWFTNEGIDE